jgi:hypothetical protein
MEYVQIGPQSNGLAYNEQRLLQIKTEPFTEGGDDLPTNAASAADIDIISVLSNPGHVQLVQLKEEILTGGYNGNNYMMVNIASIVKMEQGLLEDSEVAEASPEALQLAEQTVRETDDRVSLKNRK